MLATMVDGTFASRSDGIRDVVVVGQDAALWLSVCVIQAALAPAGVKVTAIELPTRLGPSDFYASQPALEALHGRLRIDEAQLLASTGGSFTLGQNFTNSPGTIVSGRAASGTTTSAMARSRTTASGTTASGTVVSGVPTSGTTHAFFHAYGAYGTLVADKPFLPHWLLARRFGLPATLEDFALNAAAAKLGRMLIPDPAVQSYGRADYAYHLPAREYVAALKRHAMKNATRIHEATRCDVEFSAEGAIAALKLDGERRISGQLFIDATGEEAQLMSALGSQRESWRDYFVADRILVASASRLRSIPPYAEIRAWEKGWVGLFPSQTRTHVAQVYASSLTTEDEALRMATEVAALALQDATTKVSTPGRNHHAWHRNCIAVGEAACTLDPLHSVDLHAIQLGLVHWLSLFPVSDDFDAERDEYNRVMQSSFERVRDFQSTYYALLPRGCNVITSDALKHKIETFRSRGDLPMYENETFTADSWHALLLGCGVVPETLGPMVETTSPDTIRQEFRRMLGFIKDTVLRQPSHDTYLKTLSSQGRAS